MFWDSPICQGTNPLSLLYSTVVCLFPSLQFETCSSRRVLPGVAAGGGGTRVFPLARGRRQAVLGALDPQPFASRTPASLSRDASHQPERASALGPSQASRFRPSPAAPTLGSSMQGLGAPRPRSTPACQAARRTLGPERMSPRPPGPGPARHGHPRATEPDTRVSGRGLAAARGRRRPLRVTGSAGGRCEALT